MPTTTIIIISLLIMNLALTLIMFWIIHDLLSAVKSLQDSNDLVKNSFEVCGESIENYSKGFTRVCDRENELNSTINAWSKNVLDAYGVMRERYETITDTNIELLKCWKSIEERYSQSYEQFKHCSDKLKEVSFQLTELANVSTEDEYTLTLNEACDTVCLDCPYEQCKKDLKYEDKMLDCPVWKIKSQQREIEAELEEAAEFERRKAHNECTDEDYLEAINTHHDDILEGADDDR